MNQFSNINKKAARVSNCCNYRIDMSGSSPMCCKCGFICIPVTFYEYLTEQLSNVLLGEKIPLDIVHAQSGELIIPCRRKITKTLLRKVAINYQNIDIDPSPIRNKLREVIGNAAAKFSMEF